MCKQELCASPRVAIQPVQKPNRESNADRKSNAGKQSKPVRGRSVGTTEWTDYPSAILCNEEVRVCDSQSIPTNMDREKYKEEIKRSKSSVTTWVTVYVQNRLPIAVKHSYDREADKVGKFRAPWGGAEEQKRRPPDMQATRQKKVADAMLSCSARRSSCSCRWHRCLS